MTRGTKLGGGALVVGVVCLLGWYLSWQKEGIWRISRYFRFGSRKFIVTEAKPSPRMAKLPNIYLWAWERPEELKFLGDQKVGVAFLAKTIYVRETAAPATGPTPDAIVVRPRMQPLRITPGTPLMAVVRIETLRGASPSGYGEDAKPSADFSEMQISHIATEIVATLNFPGVSAVQIDFDATRSEHDFYRAVLVGVRRRLPVEMPLSITALASWCIGDRWLEQLPQNTIDEAVPMLFRMGVGQAEVLNYISSGEEFRVSACGNSIGLSTDETLSRNVISGKLAIGQNGQGSKRIYVFSPHGWDPAQAEATLKEIQSWHAN
ncbi:MAG TPA: hypothetical protein VN025_07955 [Candidatus Dormibacteraeota bacterium]|jgi:hypothetical protein|nr:hypothetical protein [Candidatus Dormibacteraeota bacterium]